MQPLVTVSYSTVADPTTFLTLANVNFAAPGVDPQQ